MTSRKDVVARYFDGFRRGDHAEILDCLTDDVVWDLPGHAHLEGKEAFDGEIANPAFTGKPTLVIDRILDSADGTVAIGTGEATVRTGEVMPFAYCDVFTFAGDRIRRVESYVAPLGDQPLPPMPSA
jgi:ketosteroid isomerase-like protein